MAKLHVGIEHHILNFSFKAGTSRGVMLERSLWLLKVQDESNGFEAIGEVAPIEGLSREKIKEIPEQLQEIKKSLQHIGHLPPTHKEVYSLAHALAHQYPSVRMGIEMALLQLLGLQNNIWFDNSFSQGNSKIPINGLIWMGTADEVKEQVIKKLEAGFSCLKMKIGALDWETELSLLRFIRKLAPDITLRVDANGSFPLNQAIFKLQELEPFHIHSIEQPILPGHWEALALLCQKSPVPIALDEELIYITDEHTASQLIYEVDPAYLILKPTLLGGFMQTAQWIQLATRHKKSWWVTSALESAYGLAAIAQFTANYTDLMYQGLGTGQLYSNNFPPLTKVERGYIYMN